MAQIAILSKRIPPVDLNRGLSVSCGQPAGDIVGLGQATGMKPLLGPRLDRQLAMPPLSDFLFSAYPSPSEKSKDLWTAECGELKKSLGNTLSSASLRGAFH